MKRIDQLIADCDSELKSVLVADIDTGEILYEYCADTVFRSASTIKTPMMIYALRLCMDGALTLGAQYEIPNILSDTRIFDRGEQTASLRKLLYFMITVSDNTATNAIISLLGYERLNKYFRTIGMEKTTLRRRMLDWDAVKQGHENETTNREMLELYRALFRGELLDECHTVTALEMLGEQQDKSLILRYIDSHVEAYHKTGGLDRLVHDCGVFRFGGKRLYVGVFTDGAPDYSAKNAASLCGAVGELLLGL